MPKSTDEIEVLLVNIDNVHDNYQEEVEECYLVPKSKQQKIDTSEDFTKNKKLKHFCPKWLTVDIFKDWLVPHDNAFKAKCVACNKVLNAGKSELVKHAAGRKHAQNMELMSRSGVICSDDIDEQQPQSTLTLLSMGLGITGEERQERIVVSADSETQTNLSGNDSVKLVQGEKKLELLARIANAMERIADSLAEKNFPSRSAKLDPA